VNTRSIAPLAAALVLALSLLGGGINTAPTVQAQPGVPPSATPQPAPQGLYTIYLPGVVGPPSTTPPPPPPTTPTPPPTPPPTSGAGAAWLPYTATDGDLRPTYGGSVGVDSQGGIHVAYAIYSGEDQGARPVTYGYCPSNCGERASWRFAHLGNIVLDARMLLDGAGHPRMLLYGEQQFTDTTKLYQYASCDSGCTDSANWTISTLTQVSDLGGTREEMNNRYFALDAQGHPAFVYVDTASEHFGTFYATCAEATCQDASVWYEGQIAGVQLLQPALAFTPQGQPRVVAQAFDSDNENYLWYAQCDADCTTGENWGYMRLQPTHGSASHSLQVDAQGRVRLAWASGSYASAPFQPHELYFFWCDSGCTEDGANWGYAQVNLSFHAGGTIDMQLDAQGRPRIAYDELLDGLGYAWCVADCASPNAQWRDADAEPSSVLSNDYDILPIRRCTVSKWFAGVRPALALDSQGNPRIVHDAQHWWYGQEDVNGVPHICNYKDVNVTRIALFAQQ